ncbi:MAG: MBL fold metallo-hydrolase [Clostridia bacterium]
MKKFLSLLIVVILTVATYISDLPETDTTYVDTVVNEMTAGTKVCFIDVQQGDSSLIITGNQAILIDGGRNADETNVCEFISEQGIESIDLVIATHPHEDHIGGLDAVIENFVVSKLLMPDVPYNTQTYEDVITAADENNTDIIYPEDNNFFEFDSGLTLTVLLPSEDFESSDTNDDSIVCRVVIGETSIFYTGDMEYKLEEELMSQVQQSDILKVGHHGSDTSTTEEFLDKVNPSIAIISCGFANKYGHPHADVIDRLTARGIEIRQTQYEGDVIFEFDAVV